MDDEPEPPCGCDTHEDMSLVKEQIVAVQYIGYIVACTECDIIIIEHL